jgi:hypothetical protein
MTVTLCHDDVQLGYLFEPQTWVDLCELVELHSGHGDYPELCTVCRTDQCHSTTQLLSELAGFMRRTKNANHAALRLFQTAVRRVQAQGFYSVTISAGI